MEAVARPGNFGAAAHALEEAAPRLGREAGGERGVGGAPGNGHRGKPGSTPRPAALCGENCAWGGSSGPWPSRFCFPLASLRVPVVGVTPDPRLKHRTPHDMFI